MNTQTESVRHIPHVERTAIAWLSIGFISSAVLAVWTMRTGPEEARFPIWGAAVAVTVLLMMPLMTLAGSRAARLIMAGVAGATLPLFVMALALGGSKTLPLAGVATCLLHIYIYLANPAVRRLTNRLENTPY